MASQKQLDLLSTGTTRWNTWRQAYPDVQAYEPDLHEADLHGAQLRAGWCRDQERANCLARDNALRW